MKVCDSHWKELRLALDERGLTPLISGSGRKAAERLESQLMGDDSNQSYDPLLSAIFAIYSNSLSSFGGAMMEETSPCPLCFLDEAAKHGCSDPQCTRHHDSGSDWIRYAADEQLEAARKRKLVPRVQ